MIKEALDLSVAIFNPKKEKLKKLYEHISTFEEAHLLAVDAMSKKNDYAHELIVILPGWNLRMDEKDKARLKELAEEYKIEEE